LEQGDTRDVDGRLEYFYADVQGGRAALRNRLCRRTCRLVVRTGGSANDGTADRRQVRRLRRGRATRLRGAPWTPEEAE